MAKPKSKRPKNARAGSTDFKPHKVNGAKKVPKVKGTKRAATPRKLTEEEFDAMFCWDIEID